MCGHGLLCSWPWSLLSLLGSGLFWLTAATSPQEGVSGAPQDLGLAQAEPSACCLLVPGLS